MTPFQVVYGRSPGILPYIETNEVPPLISQWFATRDKLLSQLKSNLLLAQVRMKRHADLKHSELQFQEKIGFLSSFNHIDKILSCFVRIISLE